MLARLAGQGLCAQLRTLALWAPPPLGEPGRLAAIGFESEPVCSEAGATALLSACPALSSLAGEVGGTLAEVTAILRLLPAAGRKRLAVKLENPPLQPAGGGRRRAPWSADHACAMADSLVALLASGNVEQIRLGGASLLSVFVAPASRNPADYSSDNNSDDDDDDQEGGELLGAQERLRSEEAQHRLAAALADPYRGLCSIDAQDERDGFSAVLPLVLQALTPASRLAEVSLSRSSPWQNERNLLDRETMDALTAALRPGGGG